VVAVLSLEIMFSGGGEDELIMARPAALLR
jgi:hypothetical protein